MELHPISSQLQAKTCFENRGIASAFWLAVDKALLLEAPRPHLTAVEEWTRHGLGISWNMSGVKRGKSIRRRRSSVDLIHG